MTQLTYVKAPIDEEDAIAILLKAMPQEYHQILTMLKEKEPILSLESIINSLQEEEKKVGTIKKDSNGALVVSSKKGCIHW